MSEITLPMNVSLPESVQTDLRPLLIKLSIPGDWFADQVRLADDAMAVSDESWRIHVGPPEPANWALPGFEDAGWRPATNQGHVGVAPWGKLKGFAPGSQARWIWHTFSNSGSDRSTVYFRKRFVAQRGCGTIFITADDEFTALLDGQQIGASTGTWQSVQRCLVTLKPGQEHVLAIRATNKGGPGGLLVDVR